jgi:hypothetical protein
VRENRRNKSKAPAGQAGAKLEGNYRVNGVHRSCGQFTTPIGQNANRHAHIEYAGDWYRVPDTEDELWEWADAVAEDMRLSTETRVFSAILAGLLLRAIRTGEGVVYQ